MTDQPIELEVAVALVADEFLSNLGNLFTNPLTVALPSMDVDFQIGDTGSSDDEPVEIDTANKELPEL